MPGKKSLSLNQYYGHGGNQFWRILFDLFNVDYSVDYEKRTQLAINNHVAIWDVLKACERETSADSDILQEEPNDFESFFAEQINLKTIFFNGQGARDYFYNYLKAPDIPTLLLPSTSPANTRFTYREKLEKWKEITNWLS
jgi:hypoxanthine-DNA glycosylase